MAGLTLFNSALNRVPKRAESRQSAELRDTFVDSGVIASLETIDHQVLYGRRGTGKTHALRYLAATLDPAENFSIYIDFRNIGSAQVLLGDDLDELESAGRLMRDLLGVIYDEILEMALNDSQLLGDKVFTRYLDAFSDSIGQVELTGEVEEEDVQTTQSDVGGAASIEASARVSNLGIRGGLRHGKNSQSSESTRTIRRGVTRVKLNFGSVSQSLRQLVLMLGNRRVWFLLDEWSSVPDKIQPYLGEFLLRCLLPHQFVTVKIAAIEQQTNLRGATPQGAEIGLEIGADVSANLDLDEFMVFEQDAERSRSFFRGLFFKHLTTGLAENAQIAGLRRETDLVGLGFTDRRAFDELVRAAEGVPRDAINIAGRAALKASDRKISVPDIRQASRAWFQSDKEAALKNRHEAQQLLRWIIDEVIKGRKARGFLVNRKDARNDLLISLFESRVLHVVRRGYSAQDDPGERYDVYVVDYGAYVDLILTQSAPQGILPGMEDGWTDVPIQDLRAIRRAVLDLGVFEKQQAAKAVPQ
ncbi:MAG: hypothetical protein ACRCYU_02860 [Nocardioides sp.]